MMFFGSSPRSAENIVASLCIYVAICCKDGNAPNWSRCLIAGSGFSDAFDAQHVADHTLKLRLMLANHFDLECSTYDREDKPFIKLELEDAMAGKDTWFVNKEVYVLSRRLLSSRSMSTSTSSSSNANHVVPPRF